MADLKNLREPPSIGRPGLRRLGVDAVFEEYHVPRWIVWGTSVALRGHLEYKGRSRTFMTAVYLTYVDIL